jgi:hypothetical protein
MKRLLVLVLLLASMAIPASSAPSDCNAVVSMSQGRQVYNGVQFGDPPASPLEAATGEEWMLLFASGKVLTWFTIAGNWATLTERHRCGTDAEVDSVVFIFDPYGSDSPGDNGTTMRNQLGQVLAIINSRYPGAISYLTMLVGAEDHVICQILNPQGMLKDVRASKTHAARIGQMPSANLGLDLDIPCSGYADTLGHLNTAGAGEANAELGAWFPNEG